MQETQIVAKETQKIVLKAIVESPILSFDELTQHLSSRGKKIAQEEVIQTVYYSVAPGKNWHRMNSEEVTREILRYVWTLEDQIFFLLPTKQRETTIAEFNQFRLQNEQPKVSKDLVRHASSILMVDGKNLIKFRKLQKENVLQNDVDLNVQALWCVRLLFGTLDILQINAYEDISKQLSNNLEKRFPLLCEKIGKTINRICERVVEKYFPKNLSIEALRDLLVLYHEIYNSFNKGVEVELNTQGELYEQNRMIQDVIEKLSDLKEIVNKSHEGGFLSKLLVGKIKNREGINEGIESVINILDELKELNNKTVKFSGEKLAQLKKVQTDNENILIVKPQLENDLHMLNEKLKIQEEKNKNIEKELQNKIETLESSHEKIASLQQKTDAIPELDSKVNLFRDELVVAKDISVKLYSRLSRLKADLQKPAIEEKQVLLQGAPKLTESQVENCTIHKFHSSEEGVSDFTSSN